MAFKIRYKVKEIYYIEIFYGFSAIIIYCNMTINKYDNYGKV